MPGIGTKKKDINLSSDIGGKKTILTQKHIKHRTGRGQNQRLHRMATSAAPRRWFATGKPRCSGNKEEEYWGKNELAEEILFCREQTQKKGINLSSELGGKKTILTHKKN